MAEYENESVLLLQDDENDIETNEADGYDFHHLYVADEIKDDEFNRKTRGSLNKPSKKPSRIIKSTAITSEKAPTPVDRKATSSAISKTAKSPTVDEFSPEEISVLRDKMGISTRGKSIDTLTHLYREFINKCGKESVRTPRCETVSRSSFLAEVVENPAAVSSNSPILPLEANLNSDAVQDFDLDYFDDPVYVTPSGVCARADDSPAPVDFDTSFDPALGFSDAFMALLSEINVPVSQPVVEQVEQYD
ncbi:unnamed protein product [Mytilus coruscus]|uniref:Uncharacterized protein n=1 Tax=Mytilus coruscus TaxID=42192 RepID=A0A6J8DIR7_MYTCO|nr:unnamed protein product [Mytilus coruscus]